MNYQHTLRLQALRSLSPRHRGDAIEWEDLPSLAKLVRRSDFGPSTTPPWNATMPLGLGELPPAPKATVFEELIQGLHVREITTEEVFRHFFPDF